MQAAREFDQDLDSEQVLAKLEEIERGLRPIGAAFSRDINILSNRDQKLQDKAFYVSFYLRYAEFARKILRPDNIIWIAAQQAIHEKAIQAAETRVRAELSDVLGLDLRSRPDATAQAKIKTLYDSYFKAYFEQRMRHDARNKQDHEKFLEDYYYAFNVELDPAVKSFAAEAARREEERRRQEELARKRVADEAERRRREAEEAARRAAEAERVRREAEEAAAAAARPPAPPPVRAGALPPSSLPVVDNPPDANQRNPAGLAANMPLQAQMVQAAVEALRVYHGQDFSVQEQGSRTIVQLTTNRNPNPRQQLVIDAQTGTIESAKSDTEAIEVMVRAAEAMTRANPAIAFRVQCENESIRKEIISELQKKGINCVIPQPQPVAAPRP